MPGQQRTWKCKWGCGTEKTTYAAIQRHESSCSQRERTAPPPPVER